MKLKDFMAAMQAIESDRKLPQGSCRRSATRSVG